MVNSLLASRSLTSRRKRKTAHGTAACTGSKFTAISPTSLKRRRHVMTLAMAALLGVVAVHALRSTSCFVSYASRWRSLKMSSPVLNRGIMARSFSCSGLGRERRARSQRVMGAASDGNPAPTCMGAGAEFPLSRLSSNVLRGAGDAGGTSTCPVSEFPWGCSSSPSWPDLGCLAGG